MAKPTKPDPYRFDAAFERAVVWNCCTDPTFFERLGKHVETECLADAAGKLAVRAATAIYHRSRRGPGTTVEVQQELASSAWAGRVSYPEVEAVASMLASAAADPQRPTVEAVSAQLIPILRQRAFQQALIGGHYVWSENDPSELARAAEDLAEAARLGTNGAASDTETIVQTLDSVQPEKISWLWKGRIPFSKLTVVEGDPKIGKSLLCIEVAARLTRGESLPGDEARKLDPGDVVIVSLEDGLSDTIVPRMLAADADMSRIHTPIIKERGVKRPPELTPADLARIEAVVLEKKAKLLILDPLSALLPAKIDANSDKDVRRALAPLASLAERTGAAVLVVRHWNKNIQAGRAIYRGGGSIGIAAAARSLLVVAKDPDDERRRVVASGGINNSAAPASSLAYEIISDYVTNQGQPIETARVVWCGDSAHTADTLAAAPENAEEKSKLAEAVDFLRKALAGGRRLVEEVEKDASAAGIASLKRARRYLKVEREKRPGDGKWEIWIPASSEKRVEAKRDGGTPATKLSSMSLLSPIPHDESKKEDKGDKNGGAPPASPMPSTSSGETTIPPPPPPPADGGAP